MTRLAVVCCGLLLALAPMRCAQADESSLKTRRVHLTYAAEVRDVPRDAKEVRLWLPFPPSDESQQVSNITVHSDVPASVSREEEYGNQVLSLAVSNPGQSPVRVELQFDVVRRERRNAAAVFRSPLPKPSTEKPESRWLARDRLVPIDGKVFELALSVTRNQSSRLDQIRAIYDHTVSTLSYDKTGTGWGRGDIAYACDAKRGNCTDFHAVFIGLCRARGIPARFEIGVSLPIDKPAGEIAGYHCWADCHVADYGWIPVDCSEAQKHPEQREYFFGSHDENRIDFSVGRDLRLNPAQQGERLNFFIDPYAEVDGQPHDKIERKITYENREDRR
ncbi:MAG: transglutaminase domain-containing protein [Planctomycetia bacterium]|nr:transglutaminase domain-containing protein [Planctomycetia bacterium]